MRQAYPMERDFACELFRALEANPHFPIAAPQIYEARSLILTGDLKACLCQP